MKAESMDYILMKRDSINSFIQSINGNKHDFCLECVETMKSFDIIPSDIGGILVFCFKKREYGAVRELLHLIDDISKDIIENNDYLNDHQGIYIVIEELEKEIKKLRNNNSESYYTNQGIGEIPCIGYIAPNFKNFISSNEFPDALKPLTLCYTIWNGIISPESRESKTIYTTLRYAQRIIPLEMTCHANVNDIRRMMEQILFSLHSDIFKLGIPETPILPQHQTSYAIFVQSRYHDTVQKTEIIDIVTSLLQSAHCIWNQDQPHPSMLYVDLKNPKISICVELLKNICGASVIVDYITLYKKGNVQLQESSEKIQCNFINNQVIKRHG